ncbi:MAG: DNA polymerase IV [Bacilli bacterium]|nr:DNA polymerase IV [Bacilli bacterium]
MERVIFHIDVNNAFLSWTAVKLLKNGYKIDIRTIPSVIGGDEEKRHGIVLAKSPVAKKYGVVTAETLYQARKKCPGLKVYPPDYNYYVEMSKKMFEYISQYSPDVEKFSIDECFVDMSGTHYLYGNLVDLAYKIKDEIHEKFGFTVNIGIGNNKLCAKMASDFEKPDKVHTLFNNEIEEKMWPLPINDLLFVGRKTSEKIEKMGFHTIGDVARANPQIFIKAFKSYGVEIWNRANGIDDSIVDSSTRENKSISVSWTLEKDSDDIDTIKKVLLKQTDEVGRSLRRQKMYATVVAVTFKTYDFVSFSKQCSLSNPIKSNDEIYAAVLDILYKAWNFEKIRNIGIRLSNLTKNKIVQSDIFGADNKSEEKEKVQTALDKIKDKYGTDIINPASLLEKK